ncbi:16S rRNA (cytosine(1402)-N(4))-methyltransferase, partial [Candidatus Pelagibacter sp.]|nr:16S rRNA (cytosine(1402)-N(4))-methyltransferase [Candidatus Pelagibacter sp.]
MNATILPTSEKHYPVLLKEILSIISPQNGGTFIDCTFGQGGYSKEILKFNNTKVIAIDRDPDCESIAYKIKQRYAKKFVFLNKKFSEIDKIVNESSKIKAVILDLGYSYAQIKDPKKGLSFENTGQLN